MPRRLLMLSCSKRKRSEEGLLPASERYDGPIFRVLRRYLRTCSEERPGGQEQPETYILSAEFGLIPANHPIPFYERRMTSERAKALRPNTLEMIGQILTQGQPIQEIFICLGRDYQHALDGWETRRPPAITQRNARGSIGMRQAQLRDWLYGTPPPPAPVRQQGTARIRGIKMNLSPAQVLESARIALTNDSKGAAQYHMWYVQVDDQRVSPKWLVSKVTGLPVGRFHTDWARQVLNQLGIPVYSNTNALSKEEL